MTENDKNLIEKACRMVDHQLVDKLIDQADSEVVKERLRMRSSYLYHKEEAIAGCD